MTKHTPGKLALIIGKDGCVIHSPMHGCVATVKHDNNPHKEEHEANALRILKCWNSHDELVEVIQRFCDSVIENPKLWENQVTYWKGQFQAAIKKANE